MPGFAGATIMGFEKQAARAMTRVNRASGMLTGVKAEASMHYLGGLMTNHAKDQSRSGAWKTQTGNLRRSITHAVLKPGQKVAVPYMTETDGIKMVNVFNQTDGPMLVVFAGMTYGIYVEMKPGYDVLSSAVEKYKPLAKELLGSKIKFTKADGFRL